MASTASSRRSVRWRRLAFEASEAPVTPRRRRAPRLRWRWLIAAGLAALLVWFLPGLAAHTPLGGWLISQATSKLKGTLRVGRLSLGWFSPVVAGEIEVCDSQGRTVAELAELRTARSLVGLLTHLSDLGGLELNRPRLRVELRGDGSNIEDLLAEWLDSPNAAADVGFELSVVQGEITLVDQATGRQWIVEEIEGRLTLPSDRAAPLRAKLDARLDDARSPGRIAAELTMQWAEADATGPGDTPDKLLGDALPRGELAIRTEAFPLALAQPILARSGVSVVLDGRLSGEGSARWSGQHPKGQTVLRGQFTASELLFGAPWLGEDRVAMGRLETRFGLVEEDGGLRLEPSTLDCDLGSMVADGRFDVPSLDSAALGALADQSWKIEGRVDLARLATTLPRTLRIRPQTRVTGGELQWSLESRPSPAPPTSVAVGPTSAHRPDIAPFSAASPSSLAADQPIRPSDAARNDAAAGAGRQWTLRLVASDVTAVDTERTITWPQPIALGAVVRRDAAGIVIDQLRCECEFLKLDASGTPQRGSASASFDLAALVERAGQLADLDDVELTGDGWGQVNWESATPERIDATAEVQCRGMRLGLPGRPPIHEDAVVVFLSISGRRSDAALETIERAALQLALGDDRLDVELVEPVGPPWTQTAWPLRLRYVGRLDELGPRLRPWFDLGDTQLAGACVLDARIVGSREGVKFDRAELRAERLAVRSGDWQHTEDEIRLAAAGAWNRAAGQLTLDRGALDCSALRLSAERLVLDLPAERPGRLAAELTFEGDAGRCFQLLGARETTAKGRLSGRASLRSVPHDSTIPTVPSGSSAPGGPGVGTGKAPADVPDAPTAAPGDVAIDATAECVGLLLADASGVFFQEPRAVLAAQGTYRAATGRVELARLEIAANVASARAAGAVATAQPRGAELAGTLDYDWVRLMPLLRPYVGARVDFGGRGSSPFSYRGAFDPARDEAAAELAWDWGHAYGFTIGPGTLKLRLSGGILRAEPLDVALSGGQLHLEPTVRLSSEPRRLTLPAGPLARQVQITPAMCAAALMYVAPVLSGVSTAQGSFSIDLDECDIPIDEPSRGRVAGRLTIHSVEIGPGPLIRELAVLLGREAPAKLRRESVVAFALADGRVYHQGMELIFPDVTIRTHGSVGLDQSLSLVAEMPVPPKWIAPLGDTPAAATLRNQTITVPIGGTLGRPKLDARVLDQLAKRFTTNAARNVIENELGKALERLLPPPR